MLRKKKKMKVLTFHQGPVRPGCHPAPHFWGSDHPSLVFPSQALHLLRPLLAGPSPQPFLWLLLSLRSQHT